MRSAASRPIAAQLALVAVVLVVVIFVARVRTKRAGGRRHGLDRR
jgi:hypothetical protein